MESRDEVDFNNFWTAYKSAREDLKALVNQATDSSSLYVQCADALLQKANELYPETVIDESGVSLQIANGKKPKNAAVEHMTKALAALVVTLDPSEAFTSTSDTDDVLLKKLHKIFNKGKTLDEFVTALAADQVRPNLAPLTLAIEQLEVTCEAASAALILQQEQAKASFETDGKTGVMQRFFDKNQPSIREKEVLLNVQQELLNAVKACKDELTLELSAKKQNKKIHASNDLLHAMSLVNLLNVSEISLTLETKSEQTQVNGLTRYKINDNIYEKVTTQRKDGTTVETYELCDAEGNRFNTQAALQQLAQDAKKLAGYKDYPLLRRVGLILVGVTLVLIIAVGILSIPHTGGLSLLAMAAAWAHLTPLLTQLGHVTHLGGYAGAVLSAVVSAIALGTGGALYFFNKEKKKSTGPALAVEEFVQLKTDEYKNKPKLIDRSLYEAEMANITSIQKLLGDQKPSKTINQGILDLLEDAKTYMKSTRDQQAVDALATVLSRVRLILAHENDALLQGAELICGSKYESESPTETAEKEVVLGKRYLLDNQGNRYDDQKQLNALKKDVSLLASYMPGVSKHVEEFTQQHEAERLEREKKALSGKIDTVRFKAELDVLIQIDTWRSVGSVDSADKEAVPTLARATTFSEEIKPEVASVIEKDKNNFHEMLVQLRTNVIKACGGAKDTLLENPNNKTQQAIDDMTAALKRVNLVSRFMANVDIKNQTPDRVTTDRLKDYAFYDGYIYEREELSPLKYKYHLCDANYKRYNHEEQLKALSQDVRKIAGHAEFPYLKTVAYILAAIVLLLVITTLAVVLAAHTGGGSIIAAAVAWAHLGPLVAGYAVIPGVGNTAASIMALATVPAVGAGAAAVGSNASWGKSATGPALSVQTFIDEVNKETKTRAASIEFPEDDFDIERGVSSLLQPSGLPEDDPNAEIGVPSPGK